MSLSEGKNEQAAAILPVLPDDGGKDGRAATWWGSIDESRGCMLKEAVHGHDLGWRMGGGFYAKKCREACSLNPKPYTSPLPQLC